MNLGDGMTIFASFTDSLTDHVYGKCYDVLSKVPLRDVATSLYLRKPDVKV